MVGPAISTRENNNSVGSNGDNYGGSGCGLSTRPSGSSGRGPISGGTCIVYAFRVTGGGQFQCAGGAYRRYDGSVTGTGGETGACAGGGGSVNVFYHEKVEDSNFSFYVSTVTGFPNWLHGGKGTANIGCINSGIYIGDSINII